MQKKVVNRPLAGTRKRGKTREEDLALERELLADEKECAEHVMLVDLGRNDVGKVAQFHLVCGFDFSPCVYVVVDHALYIKCKCRLRRPGL